MIIQTPILNSSVFITQMTQKMGEQKNGFENTIIQVCGSNTELATVDFFWEDPTQAILEKRITK